MTQNFADRLTRAVEKAGNPIVVGLDPHLALLPDEFKVARDPRATREERAEAVVSFLTEIIDACAGRVPAVKPQSAFFEVLGADGVRAFERVVQIAKAAGLLVIGDVKRGDIGSTAAAYAQACLAGPETEIMCDAATVNPYLGTDSVQPFLEACSQAGAGIYVLARTSNPSSAEFQTLHVGGETTLVEHVADAIARWGKGLVGESGWSSVGAVVGATHPDELRRLRERMPQTPFLIPGYGAQGGRASDIKGAFDESGLHGALVNSSRGILFAWQKDAEAHWKDAAVRAIDAMRADLSSAFA